MANAPAFQDACALARANPRLGVGCHVVLVGGKSVVPFREIPSLADKDGNLSDSLLGFATKATLGQIRPGEIEREVRAQIDRIRAAGIEPSHLDSHKHTHAHPVVMNAIAKVARECGISRVRTPIERLRDSWNSAGLSAQLAAAVAVQLAAGPFASISRKYGLRSPDRFLGLAMTGKLGPVALRRMIESLLEGTTEIMLHPGECDDDLEKTGSRLQMHRQLELGGLLDPDVRLAVENEGVRLITYGDLN